MKNFKGKLSTKLGRNLITATFAIVLYLLLLNIGSVFSSSLLIVRAVSPFVAAIGIAFVFNLPMSFIECKFLSNNSLSLKARRRISILITFILFGILVYLLIVFVYPELKESILKLIYSVPTYLENLEALAYKINTEYDFPDLVWEKIDEQFGKLINFSTTLISTLVPMVITLAFSITNSIINLFLAFVISIYMLASKERILLAIKKVILAVFNKDSSALIMRVARLTNETFSNFIGGQLTEAFILTVLSAAGLFILKIEYVPLISVILGVSSIVPILGPIIGAIPCVFILLMVNPLQALAFLIFIIVLQQFEGNVIYPRVVGRSIGISGLWIMFSMLLGGSLMGVLGILLGIPSFAVFYTLLREWTEYRLSEKQIDDVNDPYKNDKSTEIIDLSIENGNENN